MQWAPGTQVDRYRIDAVLGEGGMGLVYRAFDTKLCRRVALKVLRAEQCGDSATEQEQKARMMREARAAAALDHPSTVAIFDVGEIESLPFIAMEYITGRTLRAAMSDPGVSTDTKVTWLMDVARALEAAHRAGLVHRDVKPENVMIRDDGAVKVLDFGIARRAAWTPADGAADGTGNTAVAGSSALATLTGQGMLIGTPAYMAPEQLRGDALDGRADQFAWAVTAYHVLVGTLPWSGNKELMALVAGILTETPVPLATRNPEITEEVSSVVMKAMGKSPEDRYPDMGALLAAMERATGIRPPTVSAAEPEAGIPSARKLPGVRRRLLWLIVGVAVLAAVFLIWNALRDHAELGASRSGSLAQAPVKTAPSQVVRIVDLPVAKSCNDAAKREIQIGLQRLRGADWNEAHKRFMEAVRLDPNCATAYLRAAYTGRWLLDGPERRQLLQRANELWDKLPPRDRLFLHVVEPVLLEEDVISTIERAQEAAKAFPMDAELTLLPASQDRQGLQPLEQTLAAATAALALDPEYLDAHQTRYRAGWSQGRFDEAQKGIERCLAISRTAGDCFQDQLDLLRSVGKCAEAAVAAREFIARQPQSSGAYIHYVQMLTPQDMDDEAYGQLLQQLGQRLTGGERSYIPAFLLALREALEGDFQRVLESAKAIEKDVESTETLEPHLLPVVLRVEALVEQNELQKAADEAARFFRRRQAWSSGRAGLGDLVVPPYLEYRLLSLIRDQGKVSTADLATWTRILDDSRRKDTPPLGRALLAEGFGPLSRENLLAGPLGSAAAEDFRGAGRLRGREPPIYGRVLLALGKVEEAAAAFESYTNSCNGATDPFWHTRSFLWLGEAREKLGQNEKACAAYRVVLDRWGKAEPRSVTADAARARMKVLRCP